MKRLTLSLALLTAGMMSAPAFAQTIVKVGHALTMNSHTGAGTTAFCDHIESQTQGRYKCQQ